MRSKSRSGRGEHDHRSERRRHTPAVYCESVDYRSDWGRDHGGCYAIVFVVDDDISVRESLERLITSAGWQVETFVSAQDFLFHRVW